MKAMSNQDDLRKKAANLAKLLRQAERLTGGNGKQSAAAHSAQVAGRSRDQYAQRAEVGPPGKPKNKRRRNAAGKSLLKFLTTYFPQSTGLKPFSDDHKRMIAEMERCIRHGGRRVNAVFRGFAKTTISEHAAVWAALYGIRQFVLIVGINQVASAGNIDSIKAELSENDLLAEDFPEVCKYIQALENKPQRAPHQTCDGEHTHIVWRADTIVLPTIKGSVASGVVIAARPYAKARGVKYKRRDGIQARPDLVIVDDPQDDVSAATQLQVNKNLKILRKAILQSGGFAKGLAVVVNATIIARNDMIEMLLVDPAWQGQRVPMVKSWADEHKTLWLKEYAEIRQTFDRSIPGDQERAHREATKFYRKHRRKMDAGCVVSWKHCFKRGEELSAIQHAYNILIDDGQDVFASEYQQEPIEPGGHGPLRLTAEQIALKVTGLDRGAVPKMAQHLAAHIDVHERLLYYVVSAWSPDFGGGPIDYGTYPKQPAAYFAQSSAPIAMENIHPGLVEDARIKAGLTALVNSLLATSYAREDGAPMRIGRLLIDARWKTELVKQFCRRHPQGGSIIFPAMGVGLGPTRKSFADYKPEPGAVIGQDWRLATIRSDRVVSIDVNAWKTFAATRLGMPLGTPGGWELFGRDPKEHTLFADHCVSEEPKTVVHKESGRERVIWEWKPGRPDNHGWDNLIGAAVGGSMLGAIPAGMEPVARRPKPSERPTMAQLAGAGR
jgi:hypothetical protein